MIVDGDELVTGSYNWSDTAEWSNYENIIHWYGRNVRQTLEDFQGEFEGIWESGRDNLPDWDAAMARVDTSTVQPYVRRDLSHVDARSRQGCRDDRAAEDRRGHL